MLLLAVVLFVSGIAVGIFLYRMREPQPRRDMMRRVYADMQTRLTDEGWPRNPTNDYERHLCALRQRRRGYSRDQVRRMLLSMVSDVPLNKQSQYVEDVLNSVVVGFPTEHPLGVYMEVKA